MSEAIVFVRSKEGITEVKFGGDDPRKAANEAFDLFLQRLRDTDKPKGFAMAYIRIGDGVDRWIEGKPR